jgi:hypothetical protein
MKTASPEKGSADPFSIPDVPATKARRANPIEKRKAITKKELEDAIAKAK